MKKTIIFFVVFLHSCVASKIQQNEISKLRPVKLYASTNDYLIKNHMSVNAGVLIKDESDQHITIKEIYDLASGEVIKKATSAWAIVYNENTYFNLGYSSELNHWLSYMKFDFEGRYCGAIIGDKSPKILKKSTHYNGAGLSGALMNASTNWDREWIDKKGHKKKILIINTQNISKKIFSRNAGSIGYYLTRNNLEDLIDEIRYDISGTKIKDIEFEKVLEIIEIANKR